MLKILIADDEPKFREYLKKTIKWEEYGFEICAEARNGVEALDLAHKHQPHIALLDINMPLMNGLTLAEKIKEQFKNIYIVFITGYNEFEYARKAIKLGADDYVLKPFKTEDEKSPMDYAIAEIKKVMPNVTIEVEAQLNDNGESLKARIATGDLPDIFNLSPMHFDAAINSKSILLLDDALKSTVLDKKYQKGVMEKQVFYTDGSCWAFPVTATMHHLLYYNKELFANNNIKVPTNYPEFLEAVKAFNAKDIVPIPIFAKEAWPIGGYFDMFAQRINPEGMLALNNGTAKASDPEFKDAINKMTELVKNNVFQKGATTYDYDAARALFHSGKEGANKYAMPGAAEMGGRAVAANTKNPEVTALLVEHSANGAFIKLGRTDAPISLDGLTPEKPLPPMSLKLIANKSNYIVEGTVAHSLPNKKFQTGFMELLQKMVAGLSADEFIAESDKLFESSK